MVLVLITWVKNIIFVVLFASFLELLLPNNSMQRFIRVIMGLFIMLAILSPLIDVVQNHLLPMEVPTLSGSSTHSLSILNEAKTFVAGREELSAELYKKQVAQQMQVMILALDGVADARVVIDTDNSNGGAQGRIHRVTIYIKPGMTGNNTHIKKVAIGTQEGAVPELTTLVKDKVEKLVMELYQLPKEKIVVTGLHS
jgi:stage III sporulation protein AF